MLDQFQQPEPRQVNLGAFGPVSELVCARIMEGGVFIRDILEPVARWQARELGYAYADEERFVDAITEYMTELGCVVFILDPGTDASTCWIAGLT